MSARRDLRVLLQDLFDVGDVRVFVRDFYPEISGELPEGAVEPNELFARVVEVLERHHAIDAAFFERVATERPLRAADVTRVRTRWQEAPPGPDSEPDRPSPSPPSPRPRFARWVVPSLAVVGAISIVSALVAWLVPPAGPPPRPQCPMLRGQVEDVGSCRPRVDIVGQGSAVVGADGTFEVPMRVCPLPESLQIVIKVPTYQAPPTRVEVPSSEVGHVLLHLDPVCRGLIAIGGRVSDPGGRILAAAQVARLGCEASGVTNDAGIFHLDGLDERCGQPPIELRVQPPGGARAQRMHFDEASIRGLASPFFFELELVEVNPFPDRQAPVSVSEVRSGPVEDALAPALTIDSGALVAPGGAPVAPAFAATVQPILQSVGAVEHHGSIVATAFAVGPRLVVSSRDAAETMGAHESGDSVADATVRFGDRAIPIARARLIHAFWAFAILELESDCEVPALALASRAPDPLEGREVALVSFPVRDRRRDAHLVERVFGDRLGELRVQSGRVVGQSNVSEGHDAIVFDVVTLAGQQGGPLVDVESGEVLGVQFAWSEGHGSYAIPAWELYRDVQVRALPARFRVARRATGGSAPRPSDPTNDAMRDDAAPMVAIEPPDLDPPIRPIRPRPRRDEDPIPPDERVPDPDRIGPVRPDMTLPRARPTELPEP